MLSSMKCLFCVHGYFLFIDNMKLSFDFLVVDNFLGNRICIYNKHIIGMLLLVGEPT